MESEIKDQPPPKDSTGDLWRSVMKDMEERRTVGIERYGTPLQPFNGRNCLVDAYQELLDLVVYLRQRIEEDRLREQNRPRKVVLCGSTRFKQEYETAMREETLAGRIVLTVGMFGHVEGIDMDGPIKKRLDELHLRKIDDADEVLVINPIVIVCGLCGKPSRLFTELSQETECCRSKLWERASYIGESTRREIQYATKIGKPIRYTHEETK